MTSRQKQLASRWAIGTAGVMVLLGTLQKLTCSAVGWGSEEAFARLCYSDVSGLYAVRGLGALSSPFQPHLDSYGAVEYPTGMWVVMWALAAVTHLVSGRPDVTARTHLTAEQASAAADLAAEAGTYLVITGAVCALVAALITRAVVRITSAWRPSFSSDSLRWVRGERSRDRRAGRHQRVRLRWNSAGLNRWPSTS